MDDVKKRLKILLRPGESEKRPELTWPKSMKKEPVEVVKVSLLQAIGGDLDGTEQTLSPITGSDRASEFLQRHHAPEL